LFLTEKNKSIEKNVVLDNLIILLMSDYIPYKLEHLPNELLFEIFDYIQINDLIRVFYNLNNRFNSILCSSNIHLHILYPDDIQQNGINQKILLDFLTNQKYISRLRLINDQSIPDQKFIKFSFIRSLTVDIPTPILIQMITPSIFPHLEYLRIGYTSAKTQVNKLYQDIFSNAFPLLKKCSLNNINVTKPWTGSPSILSLSLWSDNPHKVIERVLFASFHLISLHLFLHWPPICLLLDDLIIPQHSRLNSLKLHLNGIWTLEKLDSFLAYIPTVKHLSLYSSYFDSHMRCFQWNFKELAYIFLCRLPNLCYFGCEFIFENQTIIDLKQIHSLHSCFNRIKYETYSEDNLFIRLFTDK
jgi:hypothetical protein